MNEVLIARWNIDQDAMVDPPSDVRWGNGAPATYQDYVDHMDDTHSLLLADSGIEMHMFPALAADVRYDTAAKTWVVERVGLGSLALDVVDPESPDDQIIAALHSQLVVYKARIYR